MERCSLSTSVPDGRRPDIPALTSLRFFAALWIVLFHIREVGLWRGGVRPYLATIQLGYLGVSFFFVLSGFILVYVYSGRELEKMRFWQARFARIYPAYLLSLLITLPGVLFFLPQLRQMHIAGLVLAAFPLLLEAWFPRILFYWNAVAWSLSAEAFFYLVFPFVFRRLERPGWRGLGLWISAAWLASLALTTTYVLLRPDGVAHTNTLDNQLFWLSVVKFNPLVRLPDFLLGMGVGMAFLRLPARARSWPIAAGIAFIVVAIVLQKQIPYPIMHSGLLAPAFALIVFGFATQPVWTRFLAFKPMLLLGEASYSLYLLHLFGIILLAFLFHLAGSPYIIEVVVLYLIGICVLSIGVFLFIESPLRRLLRPRPRRDRTVETTTQASVSM